MQVPPEILFEGVERTPNIERLITKGLAKLEKVCDYMISVRVALEQAQGRRLQGNPYRMRIDIRLPDRNEILVRRWSKALTKVPDGQAQVHAELAYDSETEPETLPLVRRSPVRRRGVREEPLVALVRRTFDSAQRELEKTVERQRGHVKTPAQQELTAVVERIFRNEGYGFLRALDGQEVYFHKNSVLHRHWDELKAGAAVRYVPELGEKGLQASTVELVEKRGKTEARDRLQELPAVSIPPKSKKRKR